MSEVSVSYLTGTSKITRNTWFSDDGRANVRPRRSVDKMFLQPYESKEEFIYCARHTLTPTLLIGLIVMQPINLVVTPLVIMTIAGIAALSGAICHLSGKEASSSSCFEIADNIIKDGIQSLVDLLVLPVSSIMLMTRSTSTALKAADIMDYDALTEPTCKLG